MQNFQAQDNLAADGGPAPPAGYSGVWPPPMDSVPQGEWPLRFLYKRLAGNLADLREGSVLVTDSGITLAGRGMPRAEIYVPIVVAGLMFSVLLALIAHYVMRYAMLQPQQIFIPWENISQVVLVPKRNWVGLSYSAPNYRGTIKRYCFCFALEPDQFEHFEQLAQRHAPAVTSVGSLKPGTSPILLFFIILFLSGLIVLFIILAHLGH